MISYVPRLFSKTGSALAQPSKLQWPMLNAAVRVPPDEPLSP
jgi:hypothetical protein